MSLTCHSKFTRQVVLRIYVLISFSDDESYHKGHGKIYENFGIDPKVGCMVVVRPDQYVSLVTEITDHTGLGKRYFSLPLILPLEADHFLGCPSSFLL